MCGAQVLDRRPWLRTAAPCRSVYAGLGRSDRAGAPVGALVARGDVTLGFQQLSELMHVDGVDVVGGLPPLECCRGTRPSHAASWRPLSKFRASPTLAASALAVSGPIPGTFSKRRLISFARCPALICTSILSTC